MKSITLNLDESVPYHLTTYSRMMSKSKFSITNSLFINVVVPIAKD